MTSNIPHQRKRALIVGINKYPRNPLDYCLNDAEDLSKALQRIEFDVSLGTNCNRKEFLDLIESFVQVIQRNDLILFYFAGHGRQNQDQNYLILSDYNYDFSTTEENYIVEHCVNVQYIMKKIYDKRCRVSIFLFDCCRNYVRTRAMDMKQGLSPMCARSETLIAYSCAPGEAALDETKNARNGIFMQNLLKHIEIPNEDFEQVLKSVARDVKAQTDGFQLPYRTSSLTELVYLVPHLVQGQTYFSTAFPFFVKHDLKGVLKYIG
ncbi:unnamed protein product [Rotaria socialis]|uniref:Caspase family p20 domain-containing protein n=1 Tax=Rotaria socialis TaxID=392032 RepID=A0A817RDL5_9BILA|nr:unnamed protein product [Rotaria socialis]CAF3304660.1 unnamed protein product [Rotaria socialis]CAF3732054.1 unnamed protein product [Rotaria socialis]CAF4230576.1 unnamed protein product [Rotaria socialis]CAF4475545.1 unnamed protein product [Rotaria socialis]